MNFKKQYIALALLMATQVQVTFGLSASLQTQVTELRKLAANAKNSAITVKMKTLAQGINRYADDVNKMPSINEAVKAEIEAVRTDINNLMTRIGLGTAPVVQARPQVNTQQAPVRQPLVAAAQMVRTARTAVPVTKPAHQAGLLRYRMGGRLSGQHVARPTDVAQVVQPIAQAVVPTIETPVAPAPIITPVEQVVSVQKQDASTAVEPIVIEAKNVQDASTSAQYVQVSSASAQATLSSQDAAGQTTQVSFVDGGIQASTVSCDATTQAQDVRIEQLQQQLARTTQEHEFDKNRLEAAQEEITSMGKALYRKESAKPRKVSVETQAQAVAVITDAGTQAEDIRQDELAALRAQLKAQQEAHSAHVTKLERRLNKLNTELTDTLYADSAELSKLNKALFKASAKPSKKDAAAQAIAPVVISVAKDSQTETVVVEPVVQTQSILTSNGSQTDLQTSQDVVAPVVSAPYIGEPRESHVYDKIDFLASRQRFAATEPAPVVTPAVVSEQQDQVLEEVIAPVEQPKQVAGPKKVKLAGKVLRSASPTASVAAEQVVQQATAKPTKQAVTPLRSASPKSAEASVSVADDKGKQPARSLFSWPFGKKAQKPVAQPANGGASASASKETDKFKVIKD